MELKDHSQITYEEGRLFGAGAYKNILKSKGSPKTEIVHSVCFAFRASLPHCTACECHLKVAVWSHKCFSKFLLCTQDPWITLVWGNLRMSQVQSPAPSRNITKLRWGGAGLCPKRVRKSPEIGSLQTPWTIYSTSYLFSRWYVDYNMCSLNLACFCGNLTLLSIPVPSIPPCRHQVAARCSEAIPAPNWTSPSPTDLKNWQNVFSYFHITPVKTLNRTGCRRPLCFSFSEHQKLLWLCT